MVKKRGEDFQEIPSNLYPFPAEVNTATNCDKLVKHVTVAAMSRGSTASAVTPPFAAYKSGRKCSRPVCVHKKTVEPQVSRSTLMVEAIIGVLVDSGLVHTVGTCVREGGSKVVSLSLHTMYSPI